MERKLYEVFKYQSLFGVKFAVQFRCGIVGFRTKKAAIKVSEAWRKADQKEQAERFAEVVKQRVANGELPF